MSKMTLREFKEIINEIDEDQYKYVSVDDLPIMEVRLNTEMGTVRILS